MSYTRSPQRRRLRRAIAGLSAVAVGLGLSACGGGGDSRTAIEVAESDRYDLSGQTVRIGTAAETPLDLGTAYAVQLLEEWGADVSREELTDVSGLQAVVAGQIDVAARSSDEVVEGRAQGVDMVAFGGPAAAMHYVIIGNPEIESVEDLEGRSIATSGPGGFDTVLFDALLTEAGLERGDDVEEITIGGSGERTASVVAGQADASMVFLDDWVALSSRTEDVDLVDYVADLLPGLSARTMAAKRSWLDDHEELATAMACANLMANQWITDEPEAYVQTAVERITGSEESAIEEFREEALRLDMYPTDAAEVLDPQQYEETARVMLAGGSLESEVDLSEAVDTSYLESAAAEGCGTD